MAATIELSAVTDAVEAALDARFPTIEVGDGAAPDRAGDRPYLVLHFIDSAEADPGGWAQPDGLRWFVYQLTAVARSRKAAEKLCSDAHRHLWEFDDTGRPLAALDTPDLRFAQRRLVREYGTTREGQVYNAVARVRLLVTTP